MPNRSFNKSRVVLDPAITNSFRRFADIMGYKNSPHRDAFISLLEKRYAFLHKYKNFSRVSKFWINNSEDLKERDTTIREKLHNEMINRSNPKKLSIINDRLTISGIADFIFCPVSIAIKATYENPEVDVLLASELFWNDNYVEEIIEKIKNHRRLDFLFEKLNQSVKLDCMKKSRSSYKGYILNVEELVQEDTINLQLLVSELSYTEGQSKGIEEKVVEKESVSGLKTEYDSFILRGDYGDLISSSIIYRGNENKNHNYSHNKEYNVFGNPDYLFKKPNDEIFLLLSKLTWNSEAISNPFVNHIYQAIAYKHYFPELNIEYGYIFYIQSIKTVRLFKVQTSDMHIKNLENYFAGYSNFINSKKMNFDTNSINVEKCFGCSVRSLCSHKAGMRKTIQTPYEI